MSVITILHCLGNYYGQNVWSCSIIFLRHFNIRYLIYGSGTQRFRKLLVSVSFKCISYLGFCTDKHCPTKSSWATWKIPIAWHTGREQWWSQTLLAFWPILFVSLCLGDVAGAMRLQFSFQALKSPLARRILMTYFENIHKAFLCFTKFIMTGNGREDIGKVRWHVSMPGWGSMGNWRGSYLFMLW